MRNIYATLASKPHNPHYLKRYVRFITESVAYNITQALPDYVERHHICPKAPDLFPEYECFDQHPWNCAILTARQHFISHLILRKVFKGSQSRALLLMIQRLKVKDAYVNSEVYEKIKQEQAQDNAARNTGDGHWSSKPGVVHNFKVNHPKGFKGKTHKVSSCKAIGDKQLGELNHFKGKQHSPDSLAVISQKRKSKIWITDGVIDKQQLKTDPIPSGYRQGRSNGTMKDRCWITDGNIDTHIHKDSAIPYGFRHGRTHNPLIAQPA
jgi:hypothetical protein